MKDFKWNKPLEHIIARIMKLQGLLKLRIIFHLILNSSSYVDMYKYLNL